MKKFALIISLFLSIQPAFVNAAADEKAATVVAQKINLKDYEGFLGYLIMALDYTHYLHKDFVVPGHDSISLGYYGVLGAKDLLDEVKREGNKEIVETAAEKLQRFGLKSTIAAGNMVGYAVPGAYIGDILGGVGMVAEYLPQAADYFANVLSGLKPGIKGSYDINEFTEKAKKTYLACSYTDPANPSRNFKTWANENLITDALKKELTTIVNLDPDNPEKKEMILGFDQGTLLIRGRWILTDADEAGKQYHVFGTTTDPVLLQAACVEAVGTYADQHKPRIDLAGGRIQLSAGNTRWANSYPIRFYNSTIIKAPGWVRRGDKTFHKAILLEPQEAVRVQGPMRNPGN